MRLLFQRNFYFKPITDAIAVILLAIRFFKRKFIIIAKWKCTCYTENRTLYLVSGSMRLIHSKPSNKPNEFKSELDAITLIKYIFTSVVYRILYKNCNRKSDDRLGRIFHHLISSQKKMIQKNSVFIRATLMKITRFLRWSCSSRCPFQRMLKLKISLLRSKRQN